MLGGEDTAVGRIEITDPQLDTFAEPEFERRRLQRRGHPLRSTAATGVGPRHDERDLIAGIDKSPERRNGQAWRAQVDDPPDDVRRRNAHGVVVLTAG